MRIVFVATGDIALPTWDWLLRQGHQPVALITQPDKPVGRHQILIPPEVKVRAEAAGVLVMQPASLRKKNAIDAIAVLQPDLVVVMAYGQILNERFLAIPRLACINIHASLLPRYRGASCVQAAIDSGDEESGVSIMHMVRELDAGDVILQKKIILSVLETGGSLHDKLAELAPDALDEAIRLLQQGTASRMPQAPALVSHVGKLAREHGRIDWHQEAAAIERRVRAYEPWPGTFTHIGNGKRLKIFPFLQVVSTAELFPGQTQLSSDGLLVGCGKNALLLGDVQAEGGRRIAAIDYARGQRDMLVLK